MIAGALTTDDITFGNDGGATLQVAGTLHTAAAGTALVAVERRSTR